MEVAVAGIVVVVVLDDVDLAPDRAVGRGCRSDPAELLALVQAI
jgi:hypothetical protein